MSLTWAVVGALITVVWATAWALARASGKAEAQEEAAAHDQQLTKQATDARAAAAREHAAHPDKLRDDDGFRRD